MHWYTKLVIEDLVNCQATNNEIISLINNKNAPVPTLTKLKNYKHYIKKKKLNDI